MIAISGGHWDRARGAKNETGFSEYPETMEWARLIHDILRKKEVDVVLVPGEPLQTKIDFINEGVRQGEIDLAVEIHFNSSPGGRGRGSETLYCPGSVEGERIADLVQGSLGSIMAPNRGVKQGWYRMDRPGIVDYDGDIDGDEHPDAFLYRTRCPAIIIEPEFIQRESVVRDMRTIACEVIADALVEATSQED